MVRLHKSRGIIARIRLLGWSENDVSKRIFKLMDGETILEDPKSTLDWRFGNRLKIELDDPKGEEIYFGRLGKIGREHVHEVYNEVKKEFIVSPGQPSASHSNFIVYPKENLIVFEERADIKIKKFISVFAHMYLKAFQDLSRILIEPISEPYTLSQIQKDFEKIVEVDLHVVRSNPESDPEFQPIEKILHETGSSEWSTKFQNPREGLKADSPIIKGGIKLSSEGYGDYKIVAMKGEQRREFISVEQAIKIVVEGVDEPIEVAKALAKELVKWLRGRRK